MLPINSGELNNNKFLLWSLVIFLWLVAFTLLAMAIDVREKLVSKENVVGWGTLALINAGIAQGKNKSGLTWFILSLLFGPFTTFLLLFYIKALIVQKKFKVVI